MSQLFICYRNDMDFHINPATMERALRVTGRNFVAGAVFEKPPQQPWRLKEAAPILRWMWKCGTMREVVAGLERRGCTWEWLDG